MQISILGLTEAELQSITPNFEFSLEQTDEEEKEILKLRNLALEAAVEHVQAAYDKFFNNIKNGRKAGFPKFASKYKPNGNAYTTKFTNNNIELMMEDNVPHVKIPKVGKIRFVSPVGQTINSILPKNTRITSATIRRFNGIYTISLQLERVKQERMVMRQLRPQLP